jgi:hypothetical protein
MRTAVTTSVILAGALMLAGGASTVYGQSVLVADIPFNFSIAGATHPAGRYEFRAIDDDHAVEFDAFGHDAALTQIVTRIEPTTRARRVDGRLTFYKIGERYYLAQMWIPDQDGFLFHAPKATLAPERTSQVVVPLATLASLK